MKYLTILFLIISSCSSANSQSHITKEEFLNTQLGSFQIRFKNLMMTRGFSWYQGTKIDLETLLQALNDYDEHTAILFYHHQADTLFSWLINGNGIIASSLSNTSPQQLLDLEN